MPDWPESREERRKLFLTEWVKELNFISGECFVKGYRSGDSFWVAGATKAPEFFLHMWGLTQEEINKFVHLNDVKKYTFDQIADYIEMEIL